MPNDPTQGVTRSDFGGLPWPAEVLNHLWLSVLAGAPFSQTLTALPTSSGRVAFPVAAPAGAAWTKELTPLPETAMNDSALVAVVEKLATILALSNESLDDASIPIGQLCSQAVQDAMGPTMDLGLLHGDGVSPNPDGVMGKASAAAGGPDFRAAVIEAAGELAGAGANASTLVCFAHPAQIAKEWARTGTTGEPLHDDAPANQPLTLGPGIRVVGVPSLANTEALVADVSQVYLVQREALNAEPNPAYYFGSDALAVRVKARVACAAPTPLKSLRKLVLTAADEAGMTDARHASK